jgi:hypothetical protein
VRQGGRAGHGENEKGSAVVEHAEVGALRRTITDVSSSGAIGVIDLTSADIG